jgi:hypothetical protein
MGLPDDNPSSFGDHYGFGCHAGLLSGTCLRHVMSCVAVATDVLMMRETSSTRATCSGRVICRQLHSLVV